MKQNPYDVAEKNYMRHIYSKKIRPRFSYCQCYKCRQEYKKEPMFKIEAKSYLFTFYHTYYGCSHCFHTIEDFRKYLESQNKLLTHEDFEFLRKLQNNFTITPEIKEKLSRILWN